MKRKHVPGCYCCAEQTCYTLQDADLPNVSLVGWTGGNWEGNACCKCITFTPNNPITTVVCSDDYGKAELTGSCEWDIRAIENAKPRLGGCPIPENQCCAGPVFSIGNGVMTDFLEHTFRALLSYTQSTVSVCISKQDVDCNGEISQKYVVVTRYCYNVSLLSTRAINSQQIVETTLTDDGCFKKHAGEIQNYPLCDSFLEFNLSSACDSNEFNNGDLPLFSGQACFARVKFFDEPPDGEQTFNNDDDGSGCTWSFCESDFDYATEICYQVSSFVARPCWCDYDLNITTQTTTTELLSSCGCDTCFDTGLPGTNYVDIISCDPFDGLILCCTGRECNEVCYSFQTTCYNIEWTADPEDNCDSPAYTFGCSSACPATSCMLTKYFYELEDPAACFNDGGCGPSFVSPKYSVITNSGVSAQWNIDCEFIAPVELCIFAPSLTLVFS